MRKLVKVPFLVFLLAVNTISTTGQDITPKLDSIVACYETYQWNFVLLAGTKEGPFYKKAIGFRNVEEKVPMELNTLFKTESVGKMFTAVRILQLVEKGKLKLTETISQLLPNLTLANADSITIHHLLNHTSGLSSHWEHPNYDPTKLYSLEEKIENTPIRFSPPGLRTYYSNTAYFILAAIIEKIDKMPFHQAIENYIFKPAGMLHTTYFKTRGLPSDAALPYYQVSSTEFVRDDTSFLANSDMGAGGWLSNAGDLYQFLQTYLKGRYLSKKMMQVQQSANRTMADSIPGFRYGMMILQSLSKAVPVYGHNGGGRGYSVDMFFEPATGYIVVMCSNMWGTGYQITSQVFSQLLNKPITAKPQAQVTVRLVDAIRKKGTDAFIQNPEEIFEQAAVPKTEFVLLRTAESLIRLNDLSTAEVVLQVGHQLFPNSPDLLITNGNVAKKQGRTAVAAFYYITTKKFAAEKKTVHLVEEAEALLKELNKVE